MTTREFNRKLKDLSNKKGLLDKTKLLTADDDLKKQLVEKIVRFRHAVVMELVTNELRPWLASMGYLYQKQGKLYNFLCTCENMKEVTQ